MRNIAVFLGELQLDSQRKVLEGIRDAAKKDGNNVVVYCLTLSTDDAFNEGEAAAMLCEDFSIYDGFIIYSESIYSEKIRNVVIDRIKAQGKPIASIDDSIPGVINVSSDNESAMRVLSKHLISEHDIKVVNFISGPEDSIDAVTRKRVFCEELEAVGRKLDEKRCFIGDYYARSGRAAVQYFEEQGLLEADAYICANDQMALGAFYALSDRGIRVPEDTILSGYDNIFEAANHYPRITSINRYEEMIGKTAYENVIKWIDGKPYDSAPVVQSDPVFAQSCGCPAKHSVSHRVVVNQYARNKLREARYAEMVSDLIVELTSARNLDEICNSLQSRVPELGADAFTFLIGVPEKDEENDGNDDMIEGGFRYRDGEFSKISDISIVPRHPIFNDDKGGNMHVVYSLHYSNRFYGLASIRNSDMPLYSEYYRVLIMTLSSSLEQVSNIRKMEKMIKTLDEMWVFDPMTHVYNRAGFFKFSKALSESARKNKENMFFIFLDLDGLKKVNDDLGHETGDRLICDMADVLRKTRNKEELLMRYGGDEFVLFGKGMSEKEVERAIARIRTAMEDLNSTGERPYHLDASIGYHMVPYDNEKPLSALIELADQEMYKEKREKHKR